MAHTIPIRTQAEIDGIVAPKVGELVINSDTGKLQIYVSASWQNYDDASSIAGVTVDDASKTDGYALIYNNTTGNIEYQSVAGGDFSSFTSGSIPFSDGSDLIEDNANLFWDDTEDRLGIGTSSPQQALHVSVASGDLLAIFDNQGSTSSDTAQITTRYDAGTPADSNTLSIGIEGGGRNAFMWHNGYDFMRIDTSRRVLFTQATSATSKTWSSKVGIEGNVSVGMNYYNDAAPTNGLLIEGNVSIGQTVNNYALDVAGTIAGTKFIGTSYDLGDYVSSPVDGVVLGFKFQRAVTFNSGEATLASSASSGLTLTIYKNDVSSATITIASGATTSTSTGFPLSFADTDTIRIESSGGNDGTDLYWGMGGETA